MRALGLDLGTRTLGVAKSDPYGMLASGVETFHFKDDDYEAARSYVEDFVKENRIEVIVLGYPKNMNNTIGPSGMRSEAFKELLAPLGVEVVLWDERLSTKEVTNLMISANVSRKKRKKDVDKLAAVVILQGYLDSKR